MRWKICAALLFAFLFAFTLLLPCLGLAQEDGLPAYRAGEEFSASFELTENPLQAVGLQLRLEYDHSVFSLIPSNTVKNDSPLMAPDLEGIRVGTGFTASFQVLQGAPGGEYEISVSVLAAGDLNENEVEGVQFSSVRVRVVDLAAELAALQAELDAAREENAALKQELETAKAVSTEAPAPEEEPQQEETPAPEEEPQPQEEPQDGEVSFAAQVEGRVFLLSDYQFGKKLLVLNDGDYVTVLGSVVDEKLTQYYRVRASGQEGYVLGSHLTLPVKSFVESDFAIDIVGGNAVITKYLGEGGELVFSMPFLEMYSSIRIGDNAFAGCESLTKLQIDDYAVQSIGDSAFADCTSLTRVILPSTLEKIADNAFSGCPRKMLVIVKEGSYAEEYCTAHGLKHKVE